MRFTIINRSNAHHEHEHSFLTEHWVLWSLPVITSSETKAIGTQVTFALPSFGICC